MAVPTSRTTFVDYVKRRLGHPVIQLNVDPEQIEDRVDDALAKFRDYHFDGTEHVLYPYALTSTDITNKYITLAEEFVGVTRIFDVGASTASASNLFNVRYQMHLNDLFNLSATQTTPYVMAMRHMEMMEEIFVGKKPIRFNRHMDKLYIDMSWSEDVEAGQYIIIDGYRLIDPETYTDVWNDSWLKQYATCLVKLQWGENLKKFDGMQLPGGVTFNGQKIWEEAQEEKTRLEQEVINNYSLPVADMIG